ncbi:hypothetical protein [Bacteroides sp.]
METKEKSTQVQTTESENFSGRFPGFNSTEAALAYYTQMFRLLNPQEQSFSSMGIGRLRALRKKLKQHLLLLQELSEREWGQGIIEMQTTCSAFMMREGTATNRRMEVNEKISELMAFLFRMAENRSLMKSQYVIMNIHHKNVCDLIIKCSIKDSEVV